MVPSGRLMIFSGGTIVSSDVRKFLFRGCGLNKAAYQLAQIPLKYLKYFKGIDDVLGQSEGSMAQWTGLFPS